MAVAIPQEARENLKVVSPREVNNISFKLGGTAPGFAIFPTTLFLFAYLKDVVTVNDVIISLD